MATGEDLLNVMQRILLAQQHQTAMLEKFIDTQTPQGGETPPQTGAAATAEGLKQWKASHPELAKRCGAAFTALDKIQTELVATLTEEVEDGGDSFLESEFMLMDLIDRFGPRMAHLNNLRMMMLQLSSEH